MVAQQTMDQRRELAASRALERSAMYQFLSQAYAYPGEETVETLKKVDLPQAKKASAGMPVEVGPLLIALEEHLDEADSSSLEAEHRRVFTHILSTDCPPCETMYTSHDIFQETQEMSDIGGFFRAFGVEMSERERLDHMSVELEFMQFLTFKEAYAVVNHGAGKARFCRGVQRKFLQDHLGRWTRPFAQRLEKKAGGGYFGCVASLTDAFISAEVEFLRARPEPALVSPEARMASAQNADCPAAEECAVEESGGQDAR